MKAKESPELGVSAEHKLKAGPIPPPELRHEPIKQLEEKAMPGMSACRRNRGVFKADGDHFDDGFYRAYGFKRGYGRAHNSESGGRLRRRLIRRCENIMWRHSINYR